ncbi:bifunctional UDP-N-acetylglucosamine diphosphorylase/glucosamine-1-phosphate N-acetyltransferase GlmU [Mobilicoccus pelagius]|uniref:UDP-N-acetylglucosamine pyrophosphorylase/glucosamine-1-phosphate N-acetyltransferase n=1 Tax=Mobilicoccus pelagius NBRC 104925 TaxID=1089455 RepID=H5USG1_9MICO|nr:NTP transferase domain-containing protein [Mobilicoccus pelagius]GAB48669.1 UDP-N-acetylglucosamine pyrophosphorylase/glucosamine-1-phosphate N-acetyltransferase [Mobilicoccus pelagius NBRC 104925]
MTSVAGSAGGVADEHVWEKYVSPTRPAAAAVVVLAAGAGTRMKSELPKVLHPLAGRSLLGHALTAARACDPEHLVVVVRHQRDAVAAHIEEICPGTLVADQDEVPGTGRATECGLDLLPADLAGTVLVTYGDVPMLTGDTLRAVVAMHEDGGHGVTVMTANVDDPTGYGRILRDEAGDVTGIVEQKDASAEQQAITEINSGIYAFDGALLRESLAEVGTDNAQGEKYLTDVLAIARSRGRRVAAYVCDDLWQTEGVNDRVQLARMGAEMNRRILDRWMREGVTVVDVSSTWIDSEVTLGRDCRLLPGTQILGASTIGANVEIGPDTTLADVEVADGAVVVRTHAHLAVIGASAHVGPFVSLRPGSTVDAAATVAPFTDLTATTTATPTEA